MPINVPILQRLADAIRKELDLRASRHIDATDIRTVCLALGPYRNLTTLTASILFLHPNCQVLNHAGGRIFGDQRVDFLRHYTPAKFETFKRFALHTSKKGRRGDYGGSITLSHAFDAQHKLRRLCDASNRELAKTQTTCLFWKESLRTSNYIRANRVELDDLLARNAELRFLLPVRNPLDCAVSNLKTGHVSQFDGLGAIDSKEDVVDAILDEFVWYADLKERHPHRFFAFFEHDFCRQTLVAVADFLRLSPNSTWLESAIEAFEIKSAYVHEPQLIAFFLRQVEEKFARHPEFRRALMHFYEPQAATPQGFAA